METHKIPDIWWMLPGFREPVLESWYHSLIGQGCIRQQIIFKETVVERFVIEAADKYGYAKLLSRASREDSYT